MTLMELRVRQTNILNAITKIENGAQEYRIGSRTVRRADLATLYGEAHVLEQEIQLKSRPPTTVAVLRRRR